MDNRFEREQCIQRALQAARDDPDHNITKAAGVEGVSGSTVWDRSRGTHSKLHRLPSHAKLSNEQERVLVQHILRLQQQYRPINYEEIRVLANSLAMENVAVPKLFEPIGRNWIERFIARHPELKSKKEQHLEIERVAASNPSIITAWFKAVESILDDPQIEPGNIWNADEIGARHNHHQSEYAVFNRKQGPPVSIISSKTSWTSVIECVNAQGRAIKPLVIHQGEKPFNRLISGFLQRQTVHTGIGALPRRAGPPMSTGINGLLRYSFHRPRITVRSVFSLWTPIGVILRAVSRTTRVGIMS